MKVRGSNPLAPTSLRSEAELRLGRPDMIVLVGRIKKQNQKHQAKPGVFVWVDFKIYLANS
ncbi:TPA: hypothetical protein DEA21_04295 [Candidatus Uhrbacteria bacterium]|nr:hypothetical protein [Candidatus Uhrbacteria bacterium]HCU31353.1 hypothetical protein [Candidatus Uhrbacteria bacterium]